MRLRLLLWSYLFVGVVVTVRTERQDDSRLVTIDQGSILGSKFPGSDVYAFFGIPYATEPTGNDKFKAPLPPPTWNDTFEASNPIIACPQTIQGLPRSDNCLVANVYVPDTNKTNLSVLVIIPGGAFQVGAGFFSSPVDLIKTKDIIVVTINYRLGVYGFLCLGNEDAPGNAGMKDQLAALRWINKNIRQFGGNPDDVTISGCSAGGASVDLLRIVSVTDGLFNKVITESGSAVATFGVQIDPIENAKMYAKELGFNNVDDINALSEFYKNASFELLISKADVILNRPDGSVLFSPCVEKDIGVEMFLDDAPINVIRNGLSKTLPVLYSYSNMEGIYFQEEFYKWQNMMNENFEQFIPVDLKIENDEERKLVATQIKEFYFGVQPVTNASFPSMVNYFSDLIFIYSMMRSVTLHADSSNDSKFYIYEYSFIHPKSGLPGANHCDQHILLFDEDDSSLPEDYRNVKAIIKKIYTDFIELGHPVSEDSELPAWPPANASRDPHMAIGPSISLQGPANQDRSQFWDQLYQKYYRAPVPPSNNANLSSIISLWICIFSFLINYFKI